jgi:hypothetical protein
MSTSNQAAHINIYVIAIKISSYFSVFLYSGVLKDSTLNGDINIYFEYCTNFLQLELSVSEV